VMPAEGKVHYPAKVVHLLGRYPEKHCDGCGRRLLPKLYGRDQSLESPRMFDQRRFCSRKCSAQHRTGSESEDEPDHDTCREGVQRALVSGRLDPGFFWDEDALSRHHEHRRRALEARS
jgi:hypothetical protein